MVQRHKTPTTRSNSIQEQVVNMILERDLDAGAPLPAEPELMRVFGVSRNSVREALKSLQALGIVEIRHGYGTFVGGAPLHALAPGLLFHARLSSRRDYQTLRDIVEVRALLETGLIRRAAVELADHDLAQLDLELAALAAGGADERGHHDRRFHELLYQPLGNQMVLQLIGLFWDVYHRMEDELGAPETDAAQVTELHRQIIEALRQRDPDRAAQVIDLHFADIRARIERLRQNG